VQRRFFPQGEGVIGLGTTNLFYTRDHLGSVREALDGNGTLQARYDYDPYGQQAVLNENIATTFAFSGHFQHRQTGLYLAKHRGLDPSLGRWLNRDPAAEAGGMNMYAYVHNNPVRYVDMLGLCEKVQVNEVLEKAWNNYTSKNELIRSISFYNTIKGFGAANSDEVAELLEVRLAQFGPAQEITKANLLPKANVGGALSVLNAGLSTYSAVSDDLKNGASGVDTGIDGASTAASSLLVSANPIASTANLLTAGGAGALVNNGIGGAIMDAKLATSLAPGLTAAKWTQ
jgi:RHS repeat-associated protein